MIGISGSNVRFLVSCFRYDRLTIPSCLFSKEGYIAVALIACGADTLKALSDEINTIGETAASFLYRPTA